MNHLFEKRIHVSGGLPEIGGWLEWPSLQVSLRGGVDHRFCRFHARTKVNESVVATAFSAGLDRPGVESRMRDSVSIRWVAVPALVVLALISSAHTHAQQKSDATAELFGTVKGAGGAPIVLHLRAVDQNPVRYYDGYEEKTAKDGSFHFARVEPGAYRLESDTSGFTLPVPQPITLRPGERRKDVVISVKPSLSLCGRVTEDGAPKNNTWVNAYRYNAEFGNLSQTYFPHTGADGSFLIKDVAPGMYYLEGYATYYPGSFNFNGAKPVMVGDGAPSGCGLEIPLQYTGCHSTRVSGHIAAAPGDGNARYKVQFLSTNPAGGSMAAPIAMNINDGYSAGESFTTTVCPGEYDLVLSDNQTIDYWRELPAHKVVFDVHHIEVGASAIDGVELTPRAMASISGEVPGMAHNVSCPAGGPRVQVSILREGDGEFQSTVLDEKNRFSFHNVAPGEYTISIGPFAREAFYLDSILVDGKPADGRKFTVAQPQPMSMVIYISGDLAHAVGHLSPDERREPRWEVAWTRPKGSVAGKVVGANAADTTVKLQAARYNSNASAEYAAHVGTNGSFQFNAVDPGVYMLRAEGKNIVTTEYGALEGGDRGTPIVVARGARIRGLKLSTSKLSAICGKVTDPLGVLKGNVRIFLERNVNGDLYGGPSEVSADDYGLFRADGLSPGEYFFASPLDVNRIVFFSPDGTIATAAPLIVQAGKDVGCGKSPALNLRIPPNYKKTYSFRGKVNGDFPAAVGDRFWVSMLDERDSGAVSYVAMATLDAEHRFSFDKVPGGHFLLTLNSAYGPEPMIWSGPYGPVTHLLASQKIDVREGMAEVNITPLPLPTVTGTVHFSHLPVAWNNTLDVAQQRIALIPHEYRQPFYAKLSADGSFSIGPEDSGDYEVDLGLRAPLYIQSVRIDGREINGRFFHLSAGASAKLEIEVSGESGQVNAKIVPDGSLPMAEPSMFETCSKSAYPQYGVVLFPDPLFVRPIADQEPNSASIIQPRLLRSTAGGDDPLLQTLQAVAPGHYRALAVQGASNVGLPFGRRDDLTDLDQKLWNALAALGVPVTVQAADTVELELLDKTIDAERAAAKLGVSLERGLFNR